LSSNVVNKIGYRAIECSHYLSRGASLAIRSK
jgi:hypothetical protein